HHGQHGLPHLGADAVVVDPAQRLQVDAVQQLAVQRELQLLVFGFDGGATRGVVQQALLPTRFGGTGNDGSLHWVAGSREKTSTFLTAPRIMIILSGSGAGSATTGGATAATTTTGGATLRTFGAALARGISGSTP